ncbi:MAG: alanine racemase [Bacteroidota bacterium]
MADLIVNTKKIIRNIEKIDRYLKAHNSKWTLVTKILSGNKKILESILHHPAMENLHSVGDSRLSSLRTIKKINPDIQTMYIKPPVQSLVKTVIENADISLNSSFSTIEALNEEARKQGKIHKVIIMVELGELREGILRENIVDFYQRVFNLDHIETIGLGTNLGCMYGVEPTYDKLIQLSLYKELLESKFNRKLELISGGSSITLPLIGKKKVPPAMNHYRIGEAAFVGTSPFDGKKFRDLTVDAFNVAANIIELEQKEVVPDGNIGEGNVGHFSEFSGDETEKSYRAIVDFGSVDVDVNELALKDKYINFLGTTSDMTVYDLGKNLNQGNRTRYKVGDQIKLIPSYMAVARLMNSKFTEVKLR